MAVDPVASVDEGLAAIAEGLAEHEEANAAVLADDIVPVMPDLGAEGERQILRSCRANVRVVAQLLERPLREPAGADSPMPPPPLETLRYLSMLVQRSLDVDSLLNGYRVGQAALWRCCTRVAFERIEDPALLRLVLEEASEIVFRFINAALLRLRDEFETERRASRRSSSARALAVVHDLLHRGTGLSAGELRKALGYEVDSRRHVGFVVQAGTSVADDGGALAGTGAVAERIASFLPEAGGPLVLPTGPDTAWMWLPAEARLGTARLQAIGSLVKAARATVGIGEPGGGLAGFRQTHQQAREALELALLTGRPITRYGEVALLSVLSADRQRALRMMRWYLGELDADTPAAARLRETLRVLLDSNLNQRETARRMRLHAHTISYRLRRIEEILGHPLGDRCHELRSALLVRDTLSGPGPASAAPQ